MTRWLLAESLTSVSKGRTPAAVGLQPVRQSRATIDHISRSALTIDMPRRGWCGPGAHVEELANDSLVDVEIQDADSV